MYTIKKYFLLMVIFLSLFSCNNEEKKARAYLENAQGLYENAEYVSAKLKLDSIKLLYPKELRVQQDALRLMRFVELKEQERNLVYCDSMLIVRQKEAEAKKPDFLFEKDPNYDEVGKYFDKKQKLENNLQKSYLRCWVNELGELFLASVYYGSQAIKHDQLKVFLPDGSYTETQKVPYDGGMNYSFSDLGMTTEVVTYSRNKENGVVMFIYENKDKNLKADYLGGKRFSLTVSQADKQAVEKTVDFSIILSDIDRFKKEQEKSTQKITYLKSKIETKNATDEME